MTQSVGARDILRNPSLLRIAPTDTLVVEDKKSHKMLGLYIGVDTAKEFLAYQERVKLLNSAKKIAASAKKEYKELESAVDDGI